MLESNEHDQRETQSYEPHSEIRHVGKHRRRSNRQDEKDQHHGREPEEATAVDAVVLVEALDEVPGSPSSRLIGELGDSESARAE